MSIFRCFLILRSCTSTLIPISQKGKNQFYRWLVSILILITRYSLLITPPNQLFLNEVQDLSHKFFHECEILAMETQVSELRKADLLVTIELPYYIYKSLFTFLKEIIYIYFALILLIFVPLFLSQ